MKFTKMSLVAALLIGSSAFAIENTKVSGNANVFYATQDNGNNELFKKDSSAADIGLNLNLTSDLVKNDFVGISAGAGYTALTTAGLENNFVGSVWGGSHKATAGTGANYGSGLGGVKVENTGWLNEAWIAATAGKTTAKVGRMELDTPLAFTEKWSIEKNTFESAVLINQNIPDTTLVGAFVGNGNGNETFGQNLTSNTQQLGAAMGAVVNQNGDFGTFGTDGAYAIGAINNSFKPLTAQVWYYDVSRVATAYWVQGDLVINSILAGAQYVSETVDDNIVANGDTNSAYALMLGYEMKDMFTAKIAYSSVDDKGVLGNTGTNTATGTGASKLYTEAWWTYNKVTQKDTNSVTLSVISPVQGIVNLGAYYTQADQAKASGNNDMTEFTLTVGKSFGPLDATLAYINTDATTAAAGDDETTNGVQAFLTLNF